MKSVVQSTMQETGELPIRYLQQGLDSRFWSDFSLRARTKLLAERETLGPDALVGER